MKNILLVGLLIFSLRVIELSGSEFKYSSSQKQQCRIAGYSYSQAKTVNFDCLGLEDLKPYMSSNTYSNIKLGEPIERYKFLKKANTKNERRHIRNSTPLSRIAADVYFHKITRSEMIIVTTRFGLVDMIIVQLGRIGKTKVLNILQEKYSLLKSYGYLGNYNELTIGASMWHFKNGEDNILYIRTGMYDSTVIYRSNAYNIIDVIGEEENNAKKSKIESEANSVLDNL